MAFHEVVDVALNAKFNFKADRYGTQCPNSSKAKPIKISYAEDEARLNAAEKQRNIRRCYMYGSTKHIRLYCPPRSNQVPAPSRKNGVAGEKVSS